MTRLYSILNTQSNWLTDNSISLAKISPKLKPLISAKGSLTSALQALSDDNFSVNVVRQKIAVPTFHEQIALTSPLSRAAMIREVELKLYNETVVYARSVIPLKLVMNGRNGLANLGRTPLGHLLFKDGNIRVSKRQILLSNIDGLMINARRTPYDYQDSQILVSEFFLPSLLNYLPKG